MSTDLLETPLLAPPERKSRLRSSLIRAALVVIGLALWFTTQALIARRPFPENSIGDALLEFTAPVHSFLLNHPNHTNSLLISSSLAIDFLGVFLLASAIFGPSIQPFLGLVMVFALRQICQGLCALPPPQGMIWRYPGFPSLLVTYGTSNDLFFSGHTAIAVYGAICLARLGCAFRVLGLAIAVFEIATVIVLRAHYTMDVFTGAITAMFVAGLANRISPAVDRLLSR